MSWSPAPLLRPREVPDPKSWERWQDHSRFPSHELQSAGTVRWTASGVQIHSWGVRAGSAVRPRGSDSGTGEPTRGTIGAGFYEQLIQKNSEIHSLKQKRNYITAIH